MEVGSTAAPTVAALTHASSGAVAKLVKNVSPTRCSRRSMTIMLTARPTTATVHSAHAATAAHQGAREPERAQ